MIRWFLYFLACCCVSGFTVSNIQAASNIKAAIQAAEKNNAIKYGSTSSQIGLVAEAVNVVRGTIEADTRNIKVSDEVFQQELIETNSVSATQFLFLDETILTIGPESQLVLDEMVFNPNATKGKVVVNAVKGLFTFVSGSLPSESYQIKTPTATIGVRGTKFDLFVSRNGASTVILRSGAVTVRNLRGDVKRIAAINSTTSVITERTKPTAPVPASPELENLFKPLSNIQELQGKNPNTKNLGREKIENKRTQQKERILEKIKERDEIPDKNVRENAEKPKTGAEKRKAKAERREAKKKKKAEKRKAKAERREAKKKKKAQKLKAKAERREANKKKKAERRKAKKLKGAKKAKRSSRVAKKAARNAAGSAKTASRGAKKAAKKAAASAKKASKGAKKAAKKAAASAKKASKSAKKAAKKAAASAKKASKSAKKAAKKAATSAKKASKSAKKAAKKAAASAKKASKSAKKAAKKAAASAKKASKSAKLAAKKASKSAKQAAKKTSKLAKQAAKKAAAKAKKAKRDAKRAKRAARKRKNIKG